MIGLEIIENINRINEEFHSRLDKQLRKQLNFTLTDFLILNTLDRLTEASGVVSIKQESIVDHIGFNKSTVSRRLKVNEDEGRIRRIANNKSEREKLASLTQKGRQSIADARLVISSEVQELVTYITVSQQVELLDLLKLMGKVYE